MEDYFESMRQDIKRILPAAGIYTTVCCRSYKKINNKLYVNLYGTYINSNLDLDSLDLWVCIQLVSGCYEFSYTVEFMGNKMYNCVILKNDKDTIKSGKEDFKNIILDSIQGILHSNNISFSL